MMRLWPFRPRRRWPARQRDCWHHALPRRATAGDLGGPAKSYIESQLIETGMRKMFWCGECGKTWFT